jgi:hypothetical protein
MAKGHMANGHRSVPRQLLPSGITIQGASLWPIAAAPSSLEAAQCLKHKTYCARMAITMTVHPLNCLKF